MFSPKHWMIYWSWLLWISCWFYIEKLTSAQFFTALGEVVLLQLKSTLERVEVVMSEISGPYHVIQPTFKPIKLHQSQPVSVTLIYWAQSTRGEIFVLTFRLNTVRGPCALNVRTNISHMNQARSQLIQLLFYTHANKLISLIKNIMLTSFKRFPVYAYAGLYASMQTGCQPIRSRNSLHIWIGIQ